MNSSIIILFVLANFSAVFTSFLTQILIQKYDVFQIVFLNSCIFLISFFAFNKYKKKEIKIEKGEIFINTYIGIFTFVYSILWFYGLKYTSLVDATALKFLTPLLIVLLSAFVLREKIPLPNILITIFGFVGSLLIIGINIENLKNYYVYLIIVSAILSSINHIILHKVKTKPTNKTLFIRIISFSFSIIPAILNFKPMLFQDILVLFLMSGFSSTYAILLTKCASHKDINNIQFFNFIRILFAIILQYIFLRQYTGVFSLLGIFIIVISTSILFYLNKYQKQLETLNREKNDMFLQIVHDLKTPVSVIQMSNNVLSQEYKNYGSKNKFAKYIDTNITKLHNNINNILKLEKLNNLEDIKINIEKVSISELIRKSIEEIKPIIKIKNINLKTNFKNIFINTDEEKLKIVVDNILSNAIKFSKSSIEIKTYSNNKYTTISFKNDGDSIDKNELKNISKKISTRTGTGYGLNIISKILSLINGNMVIRNIKEEKYNVEFLVELKTKKH